MDVTQNMKKAMTKDEVALLVDLVQSTPILTSKETNSSTNKLKDDAWTCLARTFNARSGSVPKFKAQLKLKWDNLKKAARKRTQQIRMNNLKTGGGKPDFIPNDEILEKVTGLLGSTCTGFEVPFGGDGIGDGSVVLDVGGTAEVSVVDMDIAIENAPPINASSATHNNLCIPEDSVAETPCRGIQAKKRKIDVSEGNPPSAEGSKFFFGMPMSKPLSTKMKGKKKPDDVQTSIITRNLAIASYYKKKEKLDLESYYDKKKQKLDLEIELLKLDLAQKQNNVRVNDI